LHKSSGITMTISQRFNAVASDPQIIPGVHHYCDEWCSYCPVTRRCLAFRCTAEWHKHRGRSPCESAFTSVEEAIAFTRELAALEGASTDELDALINHPPGRSGISTSHPLASDAWEYAVRAAVVMMPAAASFTGARLGDSGPSPEEVILWCHVRIYMSLFRALVSAERSSDSSDRLEDALGFAKRGLVMVEQSRRALAAMRSRVTEADFTALSGLLDGLRRGIDERFPKARSFVRMGLDVPMA
jgi:hypothetical protein